MKLYYPKSHYDKSSRGQLFPLLKPFIKGDDFTDAQRIQVYGVSEKDFEFTDKLEEADLVILTMAWNYYLRTNKENLAVDFVRNCAILNKKIVAVTVGDFGVKVPSFNNLVLLRSGGYKSKFKKNEYTIPPFFEDPLKKYYDTKKVFLRPYEIKAVVGFCGQANLSRLNAVKEIVKTTLRNLKYYFRISKNEPQQILSTSYLRASVLNVLQNSDVVTTNFILRNKYRAGVTNNKDFHSTTLEFYDNLKNSPYIVCVRGAGNFSIRFYEALAMGRIPVFINTDCSLPLDNTISWKKHVVWVEYKDRHKVAQKVKQFHEALTEDDFIKLQKDNRNLWKSKLTLKGFYKSLNDNDILTLRI
ncbi:exostosin domain-containing protein [Aequorivita sinensis]|uniref:exostosin domain-containing protein n=1 Tax=Aequorivita sinensis TaxID=1382458 RepID=UPI002300C38B|nr:exostosin family protein [Aequorivita sinensis]